jgi:hypothetical protein
MRIYQVLQPSCTIRQRTQNCRLFSLINSHLFCSWRKHLNRPVRNKVCRSLHNYSCSPIIQPNLRRPSTLPQRTIELFCTSVSVSPSSGILQTTVNSRLSIPSEPALFKLFTSCFAVRLWALFAHNSTSRFAAAYSLVVSQLFGHPLRLRVSVNRWRCFIIRGKDLVEFYSTLLS